jgi:hypothetical protein
MRQLLIIPMVWLSLVASAHASSVQLPITTNSLDQQHFTFAVSAHSTNQATAFHITITAKLEDIVSDSEAGLRIVTRTEKDGSVTATIETYPPAIPVALKKDKRVWTADFSLPTKSLSTPGLCFVFTEFGHSMLNGKRIATPSATFYEIKLKDFAKD